MNKEKITAIFLEKLSKWETSQQHQTSGYLYEKSYVEVMKEIEKEVLQEMITEGKNEEKKTAYGSGRDKCSQGTRLAEAG